MPKKESIIEILLAKGIITSEELAKARDEMAKTGLPIEKVLEKLGYATEDDILNVLASSMHVLYVNLKDYLIDTEVIHTVPEDIARRYKAVPMFRIGDRLTVAMANPQDIIAIDHIRMKSKIPIIEPVLAKESDIENAIEQHYGVKGNLEDVIKTIDKIKFQNIIMDAQGTKNLTEIAEEPLVVKLVNLIIMQAVKDRASDIHIEPEANMVRVRFRIDGILHEMLIAPKNLQNFIASRIKVLAKIDIAETRRPQDGRIGLKTANRVLDLRVSTFPTINGENIVLRILDKTSVLFGLEELGFSKVDLDNFSKLIKSAYGIILVTGPTGSGKTTTLYSALSTINSMEKNIITVEDPVEYELPLIRQTQVNVKAGITFAMGMRNIVRQDPDIMMVGEIRDKETADIAIQASLTGHLVFSTLHTNDAPSAVTRLIDMGIEPFLISSSVIGIMAQRLVRLICKDCKGKGCAACKHTGYSGRTGIFELLRVTEKIKKLIAQKATADEIRKAAIQEGMRTLRDDGMDKVRRSLTREEEILRVTEEIL